MALLCGIDLGSLRTLSWVAWLEDGRFLLDVYVPSREHPLPASPSGWPPAFFGIDAPQGLPVPGARTRQADREAQVPTKSLPVTRAELATWPLYRSFVEAGVELFWAVHEQELASVLGLVPVPDGEGTVFETYPRLVFSRLFPGVRIPSKRKDPFAYIEAVWGRLQAAGYSCEGVVRPGVDHCDALRARRRSLPRRRRALHRHRGAPAGRRPGRESAARGVHRGARSQLGRKDLTSAMNRDRINPLERARDGELGIPKRSLTFQKEKSCR